MPTASAGDRAAVLTRLRNLETDGYRVLTYTVLVQVNPPRTTVHIVATCRLPQQVTGLRVR